jgi:uncharacterized protein (TIGR01777 family)
MRILITGGTGFIGRACTKFFLGQNHEVIILTRNPSKAHEKTQAITDLSKIDSSEKIDVIINLAGASIDKRWTDKYKKELLSSRIDTTKKVITFTERLETKPKLLISASAIGYYGTQGDKILTENSEPIDCFTHHLCQKWENEALKAKELGVRVCIARLGPVLGRSGGMMKKLIPAFRKGMGKQMGDGKQYLSWVHLFDVVNAFNFFITKESCSGVYNITAPKPTTNKEFTKTINDTLNLPTIFSIPAIIIKILFGEMGKELLLNGQHVIPTRLQEEGFKFKFNNIDEAIKQILEAYKSY